MHHAVIAPPSEWKSHRKEIAVRRAISVRDAGECGTFAPAAKELRCRGFAGEVMYDYLISFNSFFGACQYINIFFSKSVFSKNINPAAKYRTHRKDSPCRLLCKAYPLRA
jgi:hypothetical protein